MKKGIQIDGVKNGVIYVCSYDSKNNIRKLNKYHGTFVPAEMVNMNQFYFLHCCGIRDTKKYAGTFFIGDDMWHASKNYKVKESGVYYSDIVWLENEDDDLAKMIFINHSKEEYETAKKKYEDDSKFFTENAFVLQE